MDKKTTMSKIQETIDAATAILACDDKKKIPHLIDAFMTNYMAAEDAAGNCLVKYRFNGREYRSYTFVGLVIRIALGYMTRTNVGVTLALEAILRKWMTTSNTLGYQFDSLIVDVYDDIMALTVDEDRIDLFEFWLDRRPTTAGYDKTMEAICRHRDPQGVARVAHRIEKSSVVRTVYGCIIGDVDDVARANALTGRMVLLAVMAGNLAVTKYISWRLTGDNGMDIALNAIKDYPADGVDINPRYCALDCMRLVFNGEAAKRYITRDPPRTVEFIEHVIASRRRDLIDMYLTKEMVAFLRDKLLVYRAIEAERRGSRGLRNTFFIPARDFSYGHVNHAAVVSVLLSKNREAIEMILEGARMMPKASDASGNAADSRTIHDVRYPPRGDIFITHHLFISLVDRGFISREDAKMVQVGMAIEEEGLPDECLQLCVSLTNVRNVIYLSKATRAKRLPIVLPRDVFCDALITTTNIGVVWHIAGM